jgi:hypothetical protein
MLIFAAIKPLKTIKRMKKTLLIMTVAALTCSLSATAQNRVKNIYTESRQLNVEQVQNTDQAIQLNRYLFAGYNTLCLPMTLSAEQLAQAARDVKVERLAGIRQQGTTVCLYFVECTAEGIEAGVPYLIFSPTAQYLRAKNTEADGIATEVKTIRMNDADGNQVSFGSSWQLRTKEGLYGIPAKQNVAVLESILVSTTADQSFLPTRCGFSWERRSSSAQQLEIVHAAAGTTGIQSVTTGTAAADNTYYDLNGRRVTAPTKGLYIKDGKKLIK